jgi:hypothetical protein
MMEGKIAIPKKHTAKPEEDIKIAATIPVLGKICT